MTSRPPSISVVVPTHGRRRVGLLLRCLKGVERCLAWDEELEVIVVADGGEAAHYDDLDLLDLPVRLIVQEHAGPAAARNTGWRATTGEVIAFLDDDTYPTRTWLSELRAELIARPHLAGLGGAVNPLRHRNVYSRMMCDLDHLTHRLTPAGAYLITANAAFRRDALEAVGGFDERFRRAAGEDFDLCERLIAAGYAVDATDRAAVLHHHPTTMTQMLAAARRYRSAMRPAHPTPGDRHVTLPAPSDGTTTDPPAAPPAAGPKPVPPLHRQVRTWLRVRRRRLVRAVRARLRPVRKAARAQARRGWKAVNRRHRGHPLMNWIERLRYTWPQLRHVRGWYAQARHAPARPGRLMAVGEALLQAVWRAEFARPGAREPSSYVP